LAKGKKKDSIANQFYPWSVVVPVPST
jgi:hypothetical protein